MSIVAMRTARQGAAITLAACRKYRDPQKPYGFQLFDRAAEMAAEGAAEALLRGDVDYAQLRADEWRLLRDRSKRLHDAWAADILARAEATLAGAR